MATTRLRLTLGYLALLAGVVGLLSLACYAFLLHAQTATVPLVRTAPHPARGSVPLAAAVVPWLVATDVGVLLLGALGAYALAGRALRPIAEARARQERFALAASHELRTPLTVLLGTLDAALLRPRTPEEYEEVVRRAQSEAEHLVLLLDDVLALAHGEKAAVAPVLAAEPLDLRAVASAAARDLRAEAAGKQQALALDLEEPLPAYGDARALQQAITDLLDNAVTYTPVGGTIHLVGRRGRRHALLVVRDTGPGIAPEHLPHLFEPFYRADPARGNGGHVGLGLVRAARVARAHDGHLTIESQVGIGTVATLALPLHTAADDATRRPGSTPSGDAAH